MIRYRLDDLGWFQFEWLIQSLLKADLGLGVESWGGRGDYGKDAYYSGSLNFPAKHIVTEGIFVFQVKFVENGNAAGGNPKSAVLTAIRKEIGRIEDRVDKEMWGSITDYTLITNAILSAGLHEKLKQEISSKFSELNIHILGGNDVCDLLDQHSQLRRSFPQLLSLRDLDFLISEAVSKETIERSQAALDLARDLVSTFVPTSLYNRSWNVLQKYNFIVLEGPPEMGKTAIAWMIALSQLSTGWEAIVAGDPSEFFKSYKKDVSQIFVADDAFGRTEYDPSRLRKWESDLERVLGRLNHRHWLVWTSRKHILERARKQMDLQGKASKFPDPAAVLIQASELDIKEKSLILYRHAKAKNLEVAAKAIVQQQANAIVNDKNFTPERIRRFVHERLSTLAIQLNKKEIDQKRLNAEVIEAIRNPTERMMKTFNALPESHKWVLIANLETGSSSSKKQVRDIYQSHCPVEKQSHFDEVYEELCESFLKPVTTIWNRNEEGIDWTHPSYRDLVIEELAKDPALKLEFLQKMRLPGIKLAISAQGGSRGERKFPLIQQASESWGLLEKRCLVLVQSGPVKEIMELMEALQAAFHSSINAQEGKLILNILSLVCRDFTIRHDAMGVEFTPSQLKTFCEASSLLDPLPQIPNLKKSWKKYESLFKKSIKEGEQKLGYVNPQSFDEFMHLAKVIQENEPRFLLQVGFPKKYVGTLIDLLVLLGKEVEESPFVLDSAEELRDEAARFERIVGCFEGLLQFNLNPSALVEDIKEKIENLENIVSEYRERADEIDPEEPDRYDDEGYGRSESSFSVEALFSDL